MFSKLDYPTDQEAAYRLLEQQAVALLEDEPDALANYANLCALLGQFLDDINWVGFYFLKENELVLGPFQGLPACTRIAIGKGVCGTAVAENQTMRIDDVHAFPGHIACDAASNAELVIPIHHENKVIAVLDIDSPSKGRFHEKEAEALERLLKRVEPFLIKH